MIGLKDAQPAEVIGHLARSSLGRDAANRERFAADVAIAQRCRGARRILIIRFRLDRGSLRRLDLLGGGFTVNDALFGGGFTLTDTLSGGGFTLTDALFEGASLTLLGGPVDSLLLVGRCRGGRRGAAGDHRDVLA